MKVKVGSTDVLLEQGDLTEYEVDAIVNAANSELSMGAGVAAAIKRKGGTIIEEEAQRQGPVEMGDAVVTTAGNLAAGYVIHAAVMGPDLRATADLVRRATLAALRQAEELKLQTVAMPAFGAGVGRVEARDSADAMVAAIRQHLAQSTGSSLRRIHLVLFQPDVYRAFCASLGLAGTRQG